MIAAPKTHTHEPPGILNNNPGNIRHSPENIWAGQSPDQTDSRFVQFTEPLFGLRALMRNLLAYQRRHGLDTVREFIGRWSPPSENDTVRYVADVAARIGVKPDDQLDLSDTDILIGLAQAIVEHENGECPTGTDWYPAPLYLDAARLALGAEPRPSLA